MTPSAPAAVRRRPARVAVALLAILCLPLAARGQGTVEPNPMVGCVLVHRGRVVSRGWHRRYGGAHAEVEALRRLKRIPRGLTTYVTLEPCCHFGKTPPCPTP